MNIQSPKDAFWYGMKDCAGIPALGLGSSMVGYGAMCQANHLPFWFSFAGGGLIWGLPGQVAMVESIKNHQSLFVLILAVAMANIRMLPLTVTGITVVMAGQKRPWWFLYLLSHFLAVTGWTAVMNRKDELSNFHRLPYYLGFVLFLYGSGLFSVWLGFSAGEFLPKDLVMLIVFLTPLYLMLLISAARQTVHKWAVVLGAIGGTFLFPLVGDWAVLIAGVGAGSWAFFMMKEGPL